MEFVLPLQEIDAPKRHTTTLHMMLAFLLFGMGIACIVLYWFTWVSPVFAGKAYAPFIVFGCCSLIMSVTLAWLTIRATEWMRNRRNNLVLRIIELALMLAAIVVFYNAGWKMPAMLFGVMAAVLVFALFNERRGIIAARVIFNDDGIYFEGAGNKKLLWSKVEKILLKHSILTISLRDNTLIQRGITADIEATKALQPWCTEKISANAPEPATTW